MSFQGGEQIRTWESMSLRDTFTDPLGSYQFTIAPPSHLLEKYRGLLIKGQLVGVRINDIPIVTPVIDTVNTSVSRDGGVVFNLECKTVLTVTTEASADVNASKKFQSDAPIINVILETLAPYNFDTIVTDAAGNATAMSGKPISGRAAAVTATELKVKEMQVQPGEKAYTYCARLFSRLGVALRVNWEGQLLLTVPDYTQGVSYTIVEGAETFGGDRALSLSLQDTNAGQFSEVVVQGKSEEVKKKGITAHPQYRAHLKARIPSLLGKLKDIAIANLKAIKAGLSPSSLSSPARGIPEASYEPDRPTYFSTVQPFKPKYVLDKRCRDNKRCASLAKLHMGKAAENAWVLTVTVDGFMSRSSGRLWAVDTICHVRSESLGIDDDLWVHEVNFTMDKPNGQRVTLRLLPKGALIIGDIPS